MEKPNDKTEEYRNMAASCIEVAQRMSLKDDGVRMMEMAQRWLDWRSRLKLQGNASCAGLIPRTSSASTAARPLSPRAIISFDWGSGRGTDPFKLPRAS